MKKQISLFALDLEEEAKKQFDACCSEPFVLSAALMPDAHTGYVAPIGSVLRTKGVLVPAWVGYDIGCGMIAGKIEGLSNLTLLKSKVQEIHSRVQKVIPMGKGKVNHPKDISEESKKRFKELVERFSLGTHDKSILRFLKTQALNHIGSLGDGNHFIELGLDEEEKELWLVIHSGSRGVGHTLAAHYMKKASKGEKNFEATFALDINSVEGQEYLNVLDFALDFALLNRMEMAKKVTQVLSDLLGEELSFDLWVNKNHNHAVREKEGEDIFLHRKGATPADKGERGVIPASMKDGCFLVEGLGNADFLHSSSHGAGRKLSRGKARQQISLKQFQESMKNVCGSVLEATLDEAPQAYKNIGDVMKAQEKSVKVLKHIKPIINWKGYTVLRRSF